MRHQYQNPKIKFYIGDVRDKRSVDDVMIGVDYIFHAAALKQVPSCEFFPIQAVRTNIMGTQNVLDSAAEHGVKRMVVLSTDKAAYPVSYTHLDVYKRQLYTGKLDSRFGIKEMIEAFISIPDKEYQLWICGDGSDRKMVENAAKQDNRIKFFGLVRQEVAFTMQAQATLLINPRKGDEPYTKYSFPSKTMEYMASGTPTVMYPLPGIPMEYYKHLIIIPDNTKETLKEILIEWCSKKQEELDQFGEEFQPPVGLW